MIGLWHFWTCTMNITSPFTPRRSSLQLSKSSSHIFILQSAGMILKTRLTQFSWNLVEQQRGKKKSPIQFGSVSQSQNGLWVGPSSPVVHYELCHLRQKWAILCNTSLILRELSEDCLFEKINKQNNSKGWRWLTVSGLFQLHFILKCDTFPEGACECSEQQQILKAIYAMMGFWWVMWSRDFWRMVIFNICNNQASFVLSFRWRMLCWRSQRFVPCSLQLHLLCGGYRFILIKGILQSDHNSSLFCCSSSKMIIGWV